MQVTTTLPDFADAFPFEEFNRMQREVLPAVLTTDKNVVASAPTASGKTALAELAICRTLQQGGTALFIAPMRALTNEKENDWDRFEQLGYSVYVVTGERTLNPQRASRADILVMTPEKADSATRKHESRRYSFITDVTCCVVDEVHLLDSDKRGSVLEVTISRLRRLCNPRIVALSATMPNVEDVGEWLDAPNDTTFHFGDEYRPVELHADVSTYTHGENAFADKYRRLYRTLDLVEPHLRKSGQALVFVSSRQDARRAAEKTQTVLADRAIQLGKRGDYDFHTEVKQIKNDALRTTVLDGIAFHHAGLSKRDRDLIEAWFRAGHIELLFSTSTLAWGVNLPARCVVIRDTKFHDPLEGEVDMSPIDVIQMLGRAGRPEYDDVGYGWIICDSVDSDRYRRLLREGKEIESRLAEDLEPHLNAEIAMGTISDLDEVMSWLETTFYYVRARSEPEAYGFRDLRERVRSTLDGLIERGFVSTTDELGIEATPLGILASKFYLRLGTAERFHDLAERTVLDVESILREVARADEFDSVSARQSERDAIDSVTVGEPTGDLEHGTRKVYAILTSAMCGSTPAELRSDAWVIKQNALRLFAALGAFCRRFGDSKGANLTARIEARVEHGVSDDAVGLTAIDGVSSGRASRLAKRGISTPAEVCAAGVPGLVDAGFSEGVSKAIVDSSRSLPIPSVDWGAFPTTVERGGTRFHEVTVSAEGDGAKATIRVTVNEVEMVEKEAYLGSCTVPIGIFGATRDDLSFDIEIIFPTLPFHPFVDRRIVQVT